HLYLLDRITLPSNRLITRPVSGNALQSCYLEGCNPAAFSCVSISSDGKFVTYGTTATNLLPGQAQDGNLIKVFIWNRLTETNRMIVSETETASLPYYCRPTTSSSTPPRVVITVGGSGSLPYAPGVSGRRNPLIQALEAPSSSGVYVYDYDADTLALASVSSTGVAGNREQGNGTISDDGRYVFFDATSTNLVPGDSNALSDIFRRDLNTGVTERVSISSSGRQLDRWSVLPFVDADGDRVVFTSFGVQLGSELRPELTQRSKFIVNGTNSLMLRNTTTGETTPLDTTGPTELSEQVYIGVGDIITTVSTETNETEAGTNVDPVIPATECFADPACASSYVIPAPRVRISNRKATIQGVVAPPTGGRVTYTISKSRFSKSVSTRGLNATVRNLEKGRYTLKTVYRDSARARVGRVRAVRFQVK
ncbi:MAG: hypothetical protein IT290_09035, partial [Deltaproteobacteria bacterium]|nr:hypothetical protein [Deltaproteobacteria bacterium]